MVRLHRQRSAPSSQHTAPGDRPSRLPQWTPPAEREKKGNAWSRAQGWCTPFSREPRKRGRAWSSAHGLWTSPAARHGGEEGGLIRAPPEWRSGPEAACDDRDAQRTEAARGMRSSMTGGMTVPADLCREERRHHQHLDDCLWHRTSSSLLRDERPTVTVPPVSMAPATRYRTAVRISWKDRAADGGTRTNAETDTATAVVAPAAAADAVAAGGGGGDCRDDWRGGGAAATPRPSSNPRRVPCVVAVAVAAAAAVATAAAAAAAAAGAAAAAIAAGAAARPYTPSSPRPVSGGGATRLGRGRYPRDGVGGGSGRANGGRRKLKEKRLSASKRRRRPTPPLPPSPPPPLPPSPPLPFSHASAFDQHTAGR